MKGVFFGLYCVTSALAFAGPAAPDSGSPVDVLQIRNVEVIFHTAGSVLPDKNLDLMMSLYADDAVLTTHRHGSRKQGLPGQGASSRLLEGRQRTLPTREPLGWVYARVPHACRRHGRWLDAVFRVSVGRCGSQRDRRALVFRRDAGARARTLARQDHQGGQGR